MIRVLLVDDHASFREMLALVFDREPEFEVVGQAGSLAEAYCILEVADLAVVDLDLPDGDGAKLIGALRAANPHGAVLVLTGSPEREVHAQAVEAGAAGVLHKSVHTEDIIGAARRLGAGETLLSLDQVVELLRLAGWRRQRDDEVRRSVEGLTTREREVLQALACGLSDKEIADRLYIGVGTVRNHFVNIFNKLGVHSRLQVLVFALRHGIVEID
jgi:DNA-binding NarL/FixJ family response regulator